MAKAVFLIAASDNAQTNSWQPNRLTHACCRHRETAVQVVHLACVPCEVSAGTWDQAWVQWDPSWACGDPGGVQQDAAAASWPAALACVPAAPFVWQPERELPSEHIGALEAEAAWQGAGLVQRALWILVACPLALQQPHCSLEGACSSALLLLQHHTANSKSCLYKITEKDAAINLPESKMCCW